MKTKPPFDGEIHAVSAKNMPDLNSPKREPGWFLRDPTPTRDEAVARIMDDLRPYARKTLGSIRIDVVEVCKIVEWFDSLASAPAPASGRVDALAVKALEWAGSELDDHAKTPFGRYRASHDGYWSGPNHVYGDENDMRSAKAAAQADYEQRIRSALSPAATPVSEAGGFAAAMRSVLTGGRARREDWNRPSHIERRRIDGLSNPTIVMVMKDGSVGPYTPSGCDMVASDWSIHRD